MKYNFFEKKTISQNKIIKKQPTSKKVFKNKSFIQKKYLFEIKFLKISF